MLDVRSLTVRFGRNTVISDLSFQVTAGSTLAVIGPNGSGKTVLFKALIGALPYQGTIRWAAGTRIGYVPQKLDLERDLPITGMDFLRAKASAARLQPEAVDEALHAVNLGHDVAAEPLGTLAGGHFQRLLLAFALLGRPTVLLFDEPTAGIDAPGQAGVYATIHRLQREQGLTLLLISHELNLVYRHASAVLCLSRRRTFMGPPVEILTPERLEEVYGTPMKHHLHDSVAG